MYKKARYQYGSNPKHVVILPETVADVMNNIRVIDIVETETDTYVRFNSDDPVIHKLYNIGSTFLNEYLETHEVECDEDWLENHDILTKLED